MTKYKNRKYRSEIHYSLSALNPQIQVENEIEFELKETSPTTTTTATKSRLMEREVRVWKEEIGIDMFHVV